MASVNKHAILGNLGKDPEIRTTQQGMKIASFSVATSETWKDKNTGEKKERTTWHNVVIFNEGLAEIAEKYLRKGSRVYLEGKVVTRKWQAQDGSDRYTTETVIERFGGDLVLLGAPGDRPPPASSSDDYAASKSGGEPTRPRPPRDLDDEVPF